MIQFKVSVLAVFWTVQEPDAQNTRASQEQYPSLLCSPPPFFLPLEIYTNVCQLTNQTPPKQLQSMGCAGLHW